MRLGVIVRRWVGGGGGKGSHLFRHSLVCDPVNCKYTFLVPSPFKC